MKTLMIPALLLGSTAVHALPQLPPHVVAPGQTPDRVIRAVPGHPNRLLAIGSMPGRAIAMPPGPNGAEPEHPRLIPIAWSPAQERFAERGKSMAILEGGGIAAAWFEWETHPSAVRVQMIDADGSALLPDGGIQLNHSESAGRYPVVAAHPQSGAIVAWDEPGLDGSLLIRVNWVDRDGTLRWGEHGVLAFDALPGQYRVYYEPDLVVDPDGTVFVCARHNDFNIEVPVVCQKFSEDGAPLWGAPGVEVSTRSGLRVLPNAVPDGEGGLIVAWKHFGNLDEIPDPTRVEAQRVDADGERVWGGTDVLVRESSTGFAGIAFHSFRELQVLSDGAGGALIAFEDWYEPVLPMSRDLIAQHVSADGVLLWDAAGVAFDAGKHGQMLEAFERMPDGGFVASSSTYDPDTGQSLSRLQRVTPDGQAQWGPQAQGLPLTGSEPGVYEYNVFMQVHGERLLAHWTHTSSDAWFDLRFAEFGPNGERRSPDAGIGVQTGTNEAYLRGYRFDAARGLHMTVADSVTRDTGYQANLIATLDEEPLFTDGFDPSK